MNDIKKETLLNSVKKGIITEEQYQKILKLEEETKISEAKKKRGSKYIMTLYYFGALIIIFAFTYFLVTEWDKLPAWSILVIFLAFQGICFSTGIYVRNKLKFLVPGGLLITVAIAVTPFVIYSILRLFGIWPTHPRISGISYDDYYSLVRLCWMYINIATLIVASIVFLWVRFSLIAFVIAIIAYFLSMNVLEVILGIGYWEVREWVSLLYGALVIIIAKLLDKRTKEDYSLWLFLIGGLIFTIAASSTWLKNELLALLYLGIHVSFIIMSIRWNRKSLLIYGALGIYIYLGHLAYKVFKGSPLFIIVLTLIGLLMILGTVIFQKNKDKIIAKIKR